MDWPQQSSTMDDSSSRAEDTVGPAMDNSTVEKDSERLPMDKLGNKDNSSAKNDTMRPVMDNSSHKDDKVRPSKDNSSSRDDTMKPIMVNLSKNNSSHTDDKVRPAMDTSSHAVDDCNSTDESIRLTGPLRYLGDNSSFGDAVLKLRDGQVTVHRCVLAAACSVLRWENEHI
jgi:hypothetical protein